MIQMVSHTMWDKRTRLLQKIFFFLRQYLRLSKELPSFALPEDLLLLKDFPGNRLVQ
jgi:hypothetical protein